MNFGQDAAKFLALFSRPFLTYRSHFIVIFKPWSHHGIKRDIFSDYIILYHKPRICIGSNTCRWKKHVYGNIQFWSLYDVKTSMRCRRKVILINTRKPTTLYEKLKMELFWTILNNTVFLIGEELYLGNFFYRHKQLHQQLSNAEAKFNGCNYEYNQEKIKNYVIFNLFGLHNHNLRFFAFAKNAKSFGIAILVFFLFFSFFCPIAALSACDQDRS